MIPSRKTPKSQRSPRNRIVPNAYPVPSERTAETAVTDTARKEPIAWATKPK